MASCSSGIDLIKECRPGTKVHSRASNCEIFEERGRRGNDNHRLFVLVSLLSRNQKHMQIYYTQTSLSPIREQNGVSRKTVRVDIQK